MTKSKPKVTVKKGLAILSSVAMLMSYGTVGLFSASAYEVENAASTANDGDATKILFFDQYGNDITDTPIVYVDNSSIAGQSISTSVTVKILNENGTLTDDIIYGVPSDADLVIERGGNSRKAHEASLTVNFTGCKTTDANRKDTLTGGDMANDILRVDPITGAVISDELRFSENQAPCKPGKTTITFQSKSGEVRRELDVIVQEPAYDLTVTWPDPNGSGLMGVNDYNMYNSDVGVLAIANHKYQLTGTIKTAHPSANPDYLDKIEWQVYEEDSKTKELVPTKLAEISPDGLLTPKNNGVVTVVAKIMSTPAFARNKQMYEAAGSPKGFALPYGSDVITTFTEDKTPIYTDRPYTIGSKARNIYVPEVDKDNNLVFNADGSIKYKTNEKTGERITKTVNDSWKAVRSHYYLTDNNVLFGEPILGSNKKPVYTPIVTTPKFINVYIAKENPATAIAFSKAPGVTDYTAQTLQGSLKVGEFTQLEIVPTPSHNKNEPGYESGATDVFRWESSDPSIVSVDQKGVITAKKKGEATITVYGETRRDDLTYVASKPLTIRAYTEAKSVSIQPSPTSVKEGEEAYVVALLDPSTSNELVEWTSSNEAGLEVRSDVQGELTDKQPAVIKGLKEGTYEITARTRETGREAKCTVTVNPRKNSMGIILSTDQGRIIKGKPIKLFLNQDVTINGYTVDANGDRADDKLLLDIDPNDKKKDYVTIEEVNYEKIKLHGISEGDVHVIATVQGHPEISEEVTIHVCKDCDRVAIQDINKTDVGAGRNINVGTTLDLLADMIVNTPGVVHEDEIKSWTSSNPTVVGFMPSIIDEKGNEFFPDSIDGNNSHVQIKALRNGTSTITVTTLSGKQKQAVITVFTTSSVAITNVDVDAETGAKSKSITLNNELKGSFTLTAQVQNERFVAVPGAECKWSFVDPNTNLPIDAEDPASCDIGTISQTGVITATDIGVARVKVESGAKSDYCDVTVYAPIAAVTYNEIEPFTYAPLMKAQPKIEDMNFKVGSHQLTHGTDYTIEFKNNEGVGQATMTLTGAGLYTGTKAITYQINKRSLTDDAIAVEYIDKQECTGAAIIPNVNITCGGIPLTEGTDYVIKATNNVAPGTAQMTITAVAAGCYSDSLTKTFEIECHHINLIDAKVVKRATDQADGLEVGTCAACKEQNVKKPIPKFDPSENIALSLSFDQAEYGVEIGEELQLTPIAVTADPTRPTEDNFMWESSNPNIVSVDDKGVVTGKAKGIATITVYGERDEVEAVCEVGVVTKADVVTALPSPVNTRVGVEALVKAELNPAESDDVIVWTSEDESVATVEPLDTDKYSALIKGVSVGTTKVIAKAKYSNVYAEIDVNVGDSIQANTVTITTIIKDTDTDRPIMVTDSSAEQPIEYKIFTNDDIVFDSVLTEAKDGATNIADDTAVWMITDNEGDTITLPDNDPKKEVEGSSIKIHGASLGTVTVTAYAKANPNVKAQFKLKVAKRCDKITVYDNNNDPFGGRALNVDDSIDLHAVLTISDPIHPDDHEDGITGWTTDAAGSEVVEVVNQADGSCTITAKKNGTATVTVTTHSGRTASVGISVFTTSNIYWVRGVTKPENPNDLPIASIALNNSFAGSLALGVSVLNQNEVAVSNARCKWASSDESVAVVSELGVVTALNVGEVTITVRSGSKQEACKLVITAPVTAITFDPIEDYTYTPKTTSYEPQPVLKGGEHTLEKDKDYSVEYLNNTGVGRATMRITGVGSYVGTRDIPYNILRRSLKDTLVTLDPIADQDYTGDKITPDVHVYCDGVELENTVDYVVAYANNIEEGTATVTITALNTSPYSESITTEFDIVKNFIGLMGDVDGDEIVNSGDALSILRASVGAETFSDIQTKLADVNGDNTIDAADSLAVLRFSVQLVDSGVIINVQATK